MDMIYLNEEREKRDDLPLSRKRQRCLHPRFVVAVNGVASVTCGHCEKELDPWWVLRELARKCDSQRWKLKRLEELEAKREERNKKARERRAKQK